MSLTINTNLSSLNAQRNLSTSQNTLKTSMERLSSGLRINSAKDDAAGLAITDRMTSQIRGLNQAARNANDGISLAQTAEGAMQEAVTILQRIRELAVQSANDTNSARDRASLQAEVNQLVQEFDRIGHATEFNNLALLDGTFTNRNFQVGANANQTITVSINSVLAADLSFVGTVIDAGTTETGISVDGTVINAGALTINGNVMRSTDGTAVDTAKAINEANANGVTGVADIATTVNIQSFDFDIIDFTISTLSMGTPSLVTSGKDSHPAVTENATYTFSPLEAGQSITIGGMTVTASGGQATATDIAATFAGVDTGNASANGTSLSGWSTVDGYTFVSDTPNADIAVNLTAVGGGPSSAVGLVPSTAFVDGDSTTSNATISFDFNQLLEGQTMTVGGRTVTAASGDMTAADVAQAFLSTTLDGATVGNGTVSGDVGWIGDAGVGNIVNFDSGSDATGQTALTAVGGGPSSAVGLVPSTAFVDGDSTTSNATISFDFNQLLEGQTMIVGGRTVTAASGDMTAADVVQAFLSTTLDGATVGSGTVSGDVGWTGVAGAGNIVNFDSGSSATGQTALTAVGGGGTAAADLVPSTAFVDGDPTTNNATISYDFTEPLLQGQGLILGFFNMNDGMTGERRNVFAETGDMTAADIAQAFLSTTLDGATVGNGTVTGDYDWTGVSGGGNIVNFDSGSNAVGQTKLYLFPYSKSYGFDFTHINTVHGSPTQTETVTFDYPGPLWAGNSLTIGGMTVSAEGGTVDPADIAATFAGVDTGNATSNGTSLSGWSTVDGYIFVSDTPFTNVPSLDVEFTEAPWNYYPNDPVTPFVDGDPTTSNAKISFDFDLLLEGQTMTVGGRTVTATSGDMTAAEVAQSFLSTTLDGSTVGAGTVSGDVGWTGITGGGNIVSFDSGSEATGQTALIAVGGGPVAAADLVPSTVFVDGNPTTSNATISFDFGSLLKGQSMVVGGRTVTATSGDMAATEVAQSFLFTTIDGATIGNGIVSGDVGWTGVAGTGNIVNFVSESDVIGQTALTALGGGSAAATDLVSSTPFVDGDPTTSNAMISFDFTQLLEGQTMVVGGRTVTATSGDMTAAEVAQSFLSATIDGVSIGNGIVNGDVGWTGVTGGGNIVNFDSGSEATGQTALTAVGGTIGSAADIIADTYNEGHVETPISPSSMTITGINDFAAINGSTIQLNRTDITIDWTVTGATTGWDDVTTQSDLVAVLDAQAGISASALSTDGVTITTEALGAPSPATTLSAGAYGLFVTSSSSGDYALELDGADVVITGEADGIVTSQDIVDAINQPDVAGFTAAIDDNGKVVITKTDGTSFTIRESVNPSGSLETDSGGLAGIASISVLLEGQVRLSSANDIVIEEIPGTGALAASGLTYVGNATTTIDSISVATRKDAEVAIASVDAAIENIDSNRGNLGATQNRFESVIANLNNVSENLSAARSRILDADIAKETSEMTKQNILQQAGISILSQANQAPQLALSLLQNL